MFMQSNGGLTDANLFQGKDALLSGPAGGVVSMTQTGKQAGFNKLIGFDMGGPLQMYAILLVSLKDRLKQN